MLRVLTRANVGGPVQHVRLLERSLVALGIRSRVLLGRVESDEGDAADSLGLAGIEVECVPGLRRRVRPLDDLRAFLWLVRRFRRERPDLVHTHTGKAGLVARCAARIAGVPAIVHTHHGHRFHGYYGPVRSRLLLVLERFLARRTDVLLVPGEPLREELVTLGLAPPERIVAYPPAVDVEALSSSSEARAQTRAALGATPTDIVVGTLGRLVPVKAVDRLVHACATRGIPLAIAGGGPERPRLERLAESLGANRVRFVGETRRPQDFLAGLDVFALASRNEGLPAALLEAMASGLPCIAPAVGSIPEVLASETNGLLFPASDDHALARCLDRLVRDEALRARLGAEAARTIRRVADPTAMARVVAAAYRRALDASRARAGDGP